MRMTGGHSRRMAAHGRGAPPIGTSQTIQTLTNPPPMAAWLLGRSHGDLSSRRAGEGLWQGTAPRSSGEETMTQEASEQRTCLVVAAHPDDIESWCAGTIAVLVLQGWRVVYVLCTSGEKGTSNPGEAPAAVAARREAEQRMACRLVGAREPIFLQLPDGGL